MGIRLETLRDDYPGYTDEQIAEAYARRSGYHVIVTYDDSGGRAIKGLVYDRELQEVRSSPYVANVRVLFDDGMLESMVEAEARTIAMWKTRERLEKKWWQFWK